ncbi:hypothetical protein PoB_002850700 [Plakobranchus ocellatus]|uniref:Uncharacterized protein n=1 Tax=Plakobranchus ocellatus TaxID=259542 RepID=A0AAV4A3W5_9GAST|nr:hypothetical protein PoB_002850700 [Plakobranchus ocellatus]
MSEARYKGIMAREGLVGESQLTCDSCVLIRIDNVALLAENAIINLSLPYLCEVLCIADAIYDIIIGTWLEQEALGTQNVCDDGCDDDQSSSLM